MTFDLTNPDYWLPVVFLALMGLSMLIYAVLDGYDLGVGILLFGTPSASERDLMVASIGPFWDANETWLVLGIGLMLVAFPQAHGQVLGALYLPVAAMLLGLILRGVAFDFRAKAGLWQKGLWDAAFAFGSLLASLSQGYMLGRYVTGFNEAPLAIGFAVLSAVCVAAGYTLIGACWLVMKTVGKLQKRSIAWGRVALILSTIGLAAVSLTQPLVSSRIFEKWLAWPQVLLLCPIPVITIWALYKIWRSLSAVAAGKRGRDWEPFAWTTLVYVLSFAGLAYSFFPYIVPNQLTVWESASSTESLWMIFWGAIVVLPFIGGYTVLSYYIFRGKAQHLQYD